MRKEIAMNYLMKKIYKRNFQNYGVNFEIIQNWYLKYQKIEKISKEYDDCYLINIFLLLFTNLILSS